MVAVHFRIGTVLQKEFCLATRRHLGAIGPTVTVELNLCHLAHIRRRRHQGNSRHLAALMPTIGRVAVAANDNCQRQSDQLGRDRAAIP
ncbi:hypothetical protein CBM2623_B30126 [Cupriavidus taiwanensis]|nr:hypothetical protein CBM2608_B30127 [Cupriavidus taiwanensis]SPA34479.1 hypothetical protein CBM2623_B30126 [Cupriavidus taiwanensis]